MHPNCNFSQVMVHSDDVVTLESLDCDFGHSIASDFHYNNEQLSLFQSLPVS